MHYIQCISSEMRNSYFFNHNNESFPRMNSAPKRRRKSNQQPTSLTQQNQTDNISQLVEFCMARPIVQETVRQCILNSKQNETSWDAATCTLATGLSTLMEIMSSGTFPVQLPTPSPAILNPGISKPVGPGVDFTIYAKIFADNYIKLASLVPKPTCDQEPKFKTVEQDG